MNIVGDAVVSGWCARLRIERLGFQPCPGTLCCVFARLTSYPLHERELKLFKCHNVLITLFSLALPQQDDFCTLQPLELRS